MGQVREAEFACSSFSAAAHGGVSLFYGACQKGPRLLEMQITSFKPLLKTVLNTLGIVEHKKPELGQISKLILFGQLLDVPSFQVGLRKMWK